MAVVVALFATCIHVDAIYEEFPTIGSLFGYTGYSRLSSAKLRKSTMSVKEWKKLAAEGKTPMTPKEGRIYDASIPAAKSGFKVRDAMVYLPPAALSAEPPELPVMELMAGQPGSPGRFFQASHIKGMLDRYASKHDGLAPIVISPDQNGSNSNNSLCADTSQGHRRLLTRWNLRHAAGAAPCGTVLADHGGRWRTATDQWQRRTYGLRVFQWQQGRL